MPRFGICTTVDNAAAVDLAGWDYLEENVQQLLEGTVSDKLWKKEAVANASPVPIDAANSLVPGAMKVVGPAADLSALKKYMTVVINRAAKVGLETLVFGSGVARNVPDGFDREEAVKQITEFAKMSADLAKGAGITIVIEPLNKAECNIVNTVKEAMTYVEAIDHRHFQCLVDSYHFWLEEEPLDNLQRAMPWIKHVHLADKEGRVAPGLSGKSDYKPFFKTLKEGQYKGPISFEGTAMSDFAKTAPKVLSYLRQQWNEA